MPGNKTRFGFAGATEPPRESENAQTARTLLGHDVHLPRFPAGASHVPASVPPAAPVHAPALGGTTAPVFSTPIEGSDKAPHGEGPLKEPTKRMPVPITAGMGRVETPPPHSGKSNFPTIARIFGRWTTGGGFKRQSQLGSVDQDTLAPPKDTMARNVALLVIVAVLSFLSVMLVLRLPGCQDDYSRAVVPTPLPPPPKPMAAPAPVPAPVEPIQLPVPSTADLSSAKASLRPPPPVAPLKTAPAEPPRKSRPAPRPRRSSKSSHQVINNPDDLMPMRL